LISLSNRTPTESQDFVSKKLRRKQSNRESARRSRLRKAESEEKKQAEIEALTETLLQSEHENRNLRLQLAIREARLERLEAKLNEVHLNTNSPPSHSLC
jgi:hypothetical protein